MLANNGKQLGIDDAHTRAICEEIGDRLREMLGRSMNDELPPRLRDLVLQLARVDLDAATPLAPSIEDMTARDEANSLPA